MNLQNTKQASCWVIAVRAICIFVAAIFLAYLFFG